MNFLPIIQIAAITGIWGISFLLFLFPSAIAALMAPASPTQKKLVASVTCIIFIAALAFA
jgi:apolipoprotein N-acyltransferase